MWALRTGNISQCYIIGYDMMNTKFNDHVEQRALSIEKTHLYILVHWNPMSCQRIAILLFQTNHACYRSKI